MRPTSTASADYTDAHAIYPVDTSRAKDGVWLVKVPKYLAQLWQQASPDSVVGQVVIASASGGGGDTQQQQQQRPGSQVTLVTESDLLVGETGQLIPKEHQFLIQKTAASGTASQQPQSSSQRSTVSTTSGQELIILCEDDLAFIKTPTTTTATTGSSSTKETSPNGASSTATSGTSTSASASNPNRLAFSSHPRARYHRRLSVFGRVNSRAECRPPPNARYMKLKAKQIENEARKKAEGKNLRRDRDDVMQDIFKAYEKHQYYLLKDLVTIINQPTAYLAELLREIANYHPRAPHKNMWELKPEYRHYSTTSQEDSTTNSPP